LWIDRIFYEANKTGLAFLCFSMIFDEFCKIFVNIEKEKKDSEGKMFACAWSSP
jgi:hypothetical protein